MSRLVFDCVLLAAWSMDCYDEARMPLMALSSTSLEPVSNCNTNSLVHCKLARDLGDGSNANLGHPCIMLIDNSFAPNLKTWKCVERQHKYNSKGVK